MRVVLLSVDEGGGLCVRECGRHGLHRAAAAGRSESQRSSPKLFARVARVKGAAARVACGIHDEGPAADTAAALGKARELLTTSSGSPMPEPELWVRVAQQALALGDLASVVNACEAALQPLSAKREANATFLKEEWK
jgi:hypothetical protein